MASGWVNYGKGYATAGSVRQGKLCVVNGLVRTANNRVPTKAVRVGTLGPNCRPSERLIFNLNNHVGTARVDVYPNGGVVWAHCSSS